MGGLANQRRGLDQNFAVGMGGVDNQRYGMDQQFYTQQRGQDLTQVDLGSRLYSNGMNGEWGPLNQANGIYQPYGSTSGTTTNNNGGGNNWQSILGGALTGAALGRQREWW